MADASPFLPLGASGRTGMVVARTPVGRPGIRQGLLAGSYFLNFDQCIGHPHGSQAGGGPRYERPQSIAAGFAECMTCTAYPMPFVYSASAVRRAFRPG